MGETAKKILAYQKSPLILTCHHSGIFPDESLSTLTDDEKGYLLNRTESPLEPIFFELLPVLSAAGVLPVVSPLVFNVHEYPLVMKLCTDNICLPVLDQPHAEEFLHREYFEPYVTDVKRIIAKSEQRYGFGHVVHLTVLPSFYGGKYVTEEIVSFGADVLDESQSPSYLQPLYEKSLYKEFKVHSWIGINRKFFSTAQLRKDLFAKLKQIQARVVIEQ